MSRAQALALATSTLTESRGGLVEVVEEDGSTQVIPVSRGKRPWWRMTRTPLGGLLLGLLWAGYFTLRVVDSRWPPPMSYETFALVFSGLFAALYLSAAVMRLIRGGRSRNARGPASPRKSRSG